MRESTSLEEETMKTRAEPFSQSNMLCSAPDSRFVSLHMPHPEPIPGKTRGTHLLALAGFSAFPALRLPLALSRRSLPLSASATRRAALVPSAQRGRWSMSGEEQPPPLSLSLSLPPKRWSIITIINMITIHTYTHTCIHTYVHTYSRRHGWKQRAHGTACFISGGDELDLWFNSNKKD